MSSTLTLSRVATGTIWPALTPECSEVMPLAQHPLVPQMAFDQANSRNFIGLLTAFRDSGELRPVKL